MCTLSQGPLNDVIMVFAFAPIVALLLGISSIHVPWDTLFLSVVLYIVLPVIARFWRSRLMQIPARLFTCRVRSRDERRFGQGGALV